MGRDKAFILFAGVPLLTRICQTAQGVASQVFVISPWRSRYQSLIPQGCQFLQEIQPQENQSAGPLIGFSQALPQVKTEWVLLLAQDLPYLTSEILQEWSLNLPNISPDAIAFLPRYIKKGGKSFQCFLNQYLVEELFISDRALLFNCNTPEDLQAL